MAAEGADGPGTAADGATSPAAHADPASPPEPAANGTSAPAAGAADSPKAAQNGDAAASPAAAAEDAAGAPGAEEETPRRVSLRILTLTGMEVNVEEQPIETVFDIRQMLSECLELCYVTSYDLLTEDGRKLGDFQPIAEIDPPLQRGGQLRMAFRRYDEKGLRLHVALLRELLGWRLDNASLTVLACSEGTTLGPNSQQRSYPSHQRILGDRLRAVCQMQRLGPDGQPDGDTMTCYPAASHSVEYALDLTHQHSIGFTQTVERSLKMEAAAELRGTTRTGSRRPGRHPFELPEPGNLACAENDSPADQGAFLEMCSQVPAQRFAVAPPVSLQWVSRAPLPRRRLQGDLAYLEVRFPGALASHFVTCTPLGFYLNQSRSRDDINPLPASRPMHSETLVGLLYTLNSQFRDRASDLLMRRASMHPFESAPLQIHWPRHWMTPPDTAGSVEQAALRRDSVAAVLQESHPVRDWNDEEQTVRALPTGTPAERAARERQAFRLHSEYVETAIRAAVSVVDGQVSPLNPHEAEQFHVHLVSGVFISYAVDVHGHFADIGGDRAARLAAKKDARTQSVVRDMDIPEVSCVTSVVIDYRGRRVVCQPVLPGILMQGPDGTRITRHLYGVDEEVDGLCCCPEFHQRLEPLARRLCLAEHRVKEKPGKGSGDQREASLLLSGDVKGMVCGDRRRYLFETMRLLPRDLNRPQDPLALVRHELRDAYVAHLTSKARAEGQPPQPVGDGPAEPFVRFNCDLHAGLSTVELCDDPAVLEEHETALRGLAAYLKETALPRVAEDLVAAGHSCLVSHELTEVMHNRGVNMRYLGELIELLPKGATAARRICLTEVIARCAKRLMRDTAAAAPPEGLAAAMAGVLNALLGRSDADAAASPQGRSASPQGGDEVGEDVAGGTGDKKKKSKRKKKPAGGAPQAHTASPRDQVARYAQEHFAYELPRDWPHRVEKFALLRAICTQTGVVLLQRPYDFSTPAPFVADDIRDMQPVVHHFPPARDTITASLLRVQAARDVPDRALIHMSQGLANCEHTLGLVSLESAQCYQQTARLVWAIGDPEQAITHQVRALICYRRLFGHDHGAYVNALQLMGELVMAHGRPREAAQFLRRAAYLCKLLTGEVSPEIMMSIAELYQDVGMTQNAVSLVRTAQDKLAQLHGAEWPGLAKCYQQIAAALGHSHDFQGAVQEQKRALTLLQSTLGKQHEATQQAEMVYGMWVRAAVQGRKQLQAPGKLPGSFGMPAEQVLGAQWARHAAAMGLPPGFPLFGDAMRQGMKRH